MLRRGLKLECKNRLVGKGITLKAVPDYRNFTGIRLNHQHSKAFESSSGHQFSTRRFAQASRFCFVPGTSATLACFVPGLERNPVQRIPGSRKRDRVLLGIHSKWLADAGHFLLCKISFKQKPAAPVRCLPNLSRSRTGSSQKRVAQHDGLVAVRSG